MTRAELSAFTLDALARTHVRVDDRARSDVPTWDGRTLWLGNIAEEGDVLHEVAHWIVAEREDRRRANYGLGPGFDDEIDFPARHPKVFCDWAETESAVVTHRLLYLAGLPWDQNDHGVTPWSRGEHAETFWTAVFFLSVRGIDAADPLRGLPIRRLR